MNTYVSLPIFRGLDARGGKNYEQAHTHTRDNHSNDNNNYWRASEASEPLSYHVNWDSRYIYIYLFIYLFISYVRQNFELRMRSFTRIARGNFMTLPVFYL